MALEDTCIIEAQGIKSWARFTESGFASIGLWERTRLGCRRLRLAPDIVNTFQGKEGSTADSAVFIRVHSIQSRVEIHRPCQLGKRLLF